MIDILENEILPNVMKPSRYTNHELNSIHKDWNKAKVKTALIFPDVYEVGMSNLAIQILYYIINKEENYLAERVFCPWPDMENLLREKKLPLFALESKKPLTEFNLLGFSLSHELLYTNILTILDLSNIPFLSKDRNENHPLICAGGPCTFNPEPVRDIFDFFVIGEGEEVILEILKILEEKLSKKETLEKLSKIEGIYVPGINKTVKKRIIKDLNLIPHCSVPITSYLNCIHDRAVLEIMRGCPRNCRFCHAGYTGKPVRTRKPEVLIKQAKELIDNTGYDELSLLSLSSSDHPKIEEIAREIAKFGEEQKVNIALPSLRLDKFSVNLVKDILKIRQSGVTLAPEAGSQRLRNVIGKDLTEERIMEGVRVAFEGGMTNIKLYFMIGLPTETQEDIDALCDLSQEILKLGRSITKKAQITVNLSTFVPKPHTPLQWEKQISIEETYEKQKYIKQILRKYQVRWHKP
ncbi:MAG: radical SAM protein, partial [bacterium]